VAGIGVIPPYSGLGIGAGPELQGIAPANQQSTFAGELKDLVAKTDDLQKSSEALTTDFAQGRQNDIHGTMIAAAEAGISLHFLASVRNRILEAYREVMRMGA
jgi:flagellar hook-basal body complex protein FliE